MLVSYRCAKIGWLLIIPNHREDDNFASKKDNEMKRRVVVFNLIQPNQLNLTQSTN